MSATSRYRVDPAPDGLAVVQDLANTVPLPAYAVRDLLATLPDARRWVGSWPGLLPEAASVTEADLPALARLREEVRACLDGEPVTVHAAVLLHGDGAGLRLAPCGDGAAGVASAVWGQVLLAQRDDTWRRLRICGHQPCPVAFFDRSRNASRVWHDVRTCGNAVNLRASRERRRAAGNREG